MARKILQVRAASITENTDKASGIFSPTRTMGPEENKQLFDILVALDPDLESLPKLATYLRQKNHEADQVRAGGPGI